MLQLKKLPETSTREMVRSRSCDLSAGLNGTMVTHVIGYCYNLVHSIKLLLNILFSRSAEESVAI